MFFTSPEHKARFLSVMQQIDKVGDDGKIDPEYGAAVYILTSSLSTWDRASGYVSRRGIEFESMLSEVHWSGGYSALLHLAANLFNEYNGLVNVVEVCCALDDSNFQVALTSLQVRRHSLRMGDL